MYGKLVNGRLYKSPSTLYLDNKQMHSPDAESLAKCGYRPVIFTEPPCKDETDFDLSYHWKETEEGIEQEWQKSEFPIDPDSQYIKDCRKVCFEITDLSREVKKRYEMLTYEINIRKSQIPFYGELLELFQSKLPDLSEQEIWEKLSDNESDEYRNYDLKEFFEQRKCNWDGVSATYSKDGKDYYIFSRMKIAQLNNMRQDQINKTSYYSMAFIYLFTMADSFIQNTLSYIMKKQPETMLTVFKKDPFLNYVLQNKSTEQGLIEYLISTCSEQIGYKSIEDKLGLFKEIGLDLAQVSDNLKDKLIIFAERRNILVHNNGVVNAGMIGKIKNTVYKDSFAIGDCIKPNYSDTIDFIKDVEKWLKDLENTVLQKFGTN